MFAMSAFQQQQHLNANASDTSPHNSSGSSYQFILDHILTYPGSYEIPLRTMYTLNCAPRAQPVHTRSNTPSSTHSSPLQQPCAWQDSQATQTFTESLMAQISQLPLQPASLPPSFITSFVRRCFAPELIQVDFPQALTGLDYLKDLEMRRRREVGAAMGRLDIDRATFDRDALSLSDRHAEVLQWVKTIEEKERKVEALYTQLYVALRRWILINELSLLPFNKHNCVAMLNTLYPPVVSAQPTSKLTPAVLKAQRDGFFKYIISVEKTGPRILINLMQQGRGPTEENGWSSVTRTLGLYLQLANSIITDCADIATLQDISPRKPEGSRPARKVDSGVSFTSTDARSFRTSSNAEPISPTEPLPRPKTPSGVRSGTTLEKLARGLKTIGRSRTDVSEIVTDDALTSPPPTKPRTLRKMRSMGALELRKAQASLAKAPESPTFDVEAMRVQRSKYDATALLAHQTGLRRSHEV